MEYFTIVAYLFTLTVASGKENIQRRSPLLLVAKETGEILECELDNPNKWKFMYHPSRLPATSAVVRGEYLYASNDFGYIFRCDYYTKKPCTIFHKAHAHCASYLAAVSRYLFAGLFDGTILRCNLNQPNSCLKFHHFPNAVTSIFEYGEYIYVATYESLFYCLKDVALSCIQVEINEPIFLHQVAHIGNVMVAFDHRNYSVASYNLTSKDALILIQNVGFPTVIYSIAILKRMIYVLTGSGNIEACQADKESEFKTVARLQDAVSITTVYGVHRVRNGYEQRDTCDQRPSTVFNYDVERRAMLEVSVMDGMLCDARGTAVDTRHADSGYSGRAAVFAMGPDGQLLLSNAHSSGLVHISSLFAGHAVAGAGEIIVENGIVKKIISCSMYYWPDVELNRQVVDELIKKGYNFKRAEEISLEECAYSCDKN